MASLSAVVSYQLHHSAWNHLQTSEGALSPTIQTTNKDVKEHPYQERSPRIPLVTALHLDMEPLTTTLWPQPSSQFLIYHIVHPLYSSLSNLETYLESIYFFKVFLITNGISCMYNITVRKTKLEYFSVFIYKAFFGLAEKNQNSVCLVVKANLFQTESITEESAQSITLSKHQKL